MAILSDDFNRADDATSPGTSSSGHAWIEAVGNIGILSNQAYATATANNQAFIDSGESDVDVRVTIAAGSSTERAGIAFRAETASTRHRNNWRFGRHSVSGYVALHRVVENVAVVTDFTNAVSPSNGSVLRVRAIGDTIRCYVNDTLVITRVDSTHQANTYHGIYITESGSRLDDWSVDSTAQGDAGPATAATVAYGASTAPTVNLTEVSASVVTGDASIHTSVPAGHASASIATNAPTPALMASAGTVAAAVGVSAPATAVTSGAGSASATTEAAQPSIYVESSPGLIVASAVSLGAGGDVSSPAGHVETSTTIDDASSTISAPAGTSLVDVVTQAPSITIGGYAVACERWPGSWSPGCTEENQGASDCPSASATADNSPVALSVNAGHVSAAATCNPSSASMSFGAGTSSASIVVEDSIEAALAAAADTVSGATETFAATVIRFDNVSALSAQASALSAAYGAVAVVVQDSDALPGAASVDAAAFAPYAVINQTTPAARTLMIYGR